MNGKYYCDKHKRNHYPETSCKYCDGKDKETPAFVSIPYDSLVEAINSIRIGIESSNELHNTYKSIYNASWVKRMGSEIEEMKSTIEKLERLM